MRQSPVVLVGLAVLMAAFVSLAGSSPTLADARRAYPGAPPVVPHPVSDALAEGKACLPCHADGGWAPIYGGYAPVVPHPELQSCWQCHVPQRVRSATPAFERPAAGGTR